MEKVMVIPRFRDLNLAFVVTGFLLVATMILVVRYQIYLMNYMEWGDESETVVIAKLLASGLSLYSEVFSQHGPLVYLPGLLVEKVSDATISTHRISIACLQLLALLALYCSPLIKSRTVGNSYVMLAATIMVVYISAYFGHMYLYHSVAGLMVVIILAQLTLPAIVVPEKLTLRHVVLGNVLIGALPFLAVTYLPAAILLFIASSRSPFLIAAWLSLIGALLANFAYLTVIGSIPGFLAIHLYLNLFVYAAMPHTGMGGPEAILLSIFAIFSYDFSGFLLLLAFVFAMIALAMNEGRLPWRTFALALAVGSLTVRGASFWGVPFYYAMLALPLIFAFHAPVFRGKALVYICLAAAICFAKLSLMLPYDAQRFQARKIRETTEFAQIVQRLTAPDDRIIAYSFNNFEYLAAKRLPASGSIYYLPHQEFYNEEPVLGITVTACRDIAQYQPKVMLIDKWNAWNRYPWGTYGQCVQEVLDAGYTQIENKPYYVRTDILLAHLGVPSLAAGQAATVDDILR